MSCRTPTLDKLLDKKKKQVKYTSYIMSFPYI